MVAIMNLHFDTSCKYLTELMSSQDLSRLLHHATSDDRITVNSVVC